MAKSTVAILTNFMDFCPQYSLTGIVQDQCKMLNSNGHPVKLFVNSNYKMVDADKLKFTHSAPGGTSVDLYCDIPFSHLIDYTSIKDLTDEHKAIVEKTRKILVKELQDVRFVFTHDFLFTGWFLPYGIGVVEAAKELPNTKFFHWLHSVPSVQRDWWQFELWGDVLKNHKIIFPNSTEEVKVAEQYRTLPGNVSCIHHIKDLRTWYDFGDDTNKFIYDYPNVLSSDIVKVYPISSDRFGAKGLDIVMKIFSELKNMGKSVFLIIANQWATGKEREKDVTNFKSFGEEIGLKYGVDFVFTSLWNEGKYDTGIPKKMLRELSNCANMFVYPTKEESFGLVGVEIPLSSAVITITNKSLKMMSEIHHYLTDSHHFGSFDHSFTCDNYHKYYRDIAFLAHSSLMLNKVVKHRTMIRRKYNWDYLYLNEYLPLMRQEQNVIEREDDD